jgi:hypothetical protein
VVASVFCIYLPLDIRPIRGNPLYAEKSALQEVGDPAFGD